VAVRLRDATRFKRLAQVTALPGANKLAALLIDVGVAEADTGGRPGRSPGPSVVSAKYMP